MTLAHTRVKVQFNEEESTIVFPHGLNQSEMVKICFAFYDIEGREPEHFALIKKSDNYRPAFSNEVAKNDILELIEIRPLFLVKGPPLEDLSVDNTHISISEDDLVKFPENVGEIADTISQSTDLEEEEPIAEIVVEIDDFSTKEFEDRADLKKKIREWSCDNKCKFNLKSQERQNVSDNVKVSTFFCSKKAKNGCEFYIEFRTNPKTSKYKLHTYFNVHNHSFGQFDSASLLTDDILERLKELCKAGTDTSTAQKLINTDFKRNFHWRTIYHQITKIKNKEYGKVNQDAQKLIDMLRNDAEERKGFSKIKTNSDNQLTGFCFMSRRMKKI